MRLVFALLLAHSAAVAQVHPDPVLARMIPPESTSLLGARMDQIKVTPIYRKLVAENKLPDFERFTRETGFDPRRDVTELMLASKGAQNDSVALARGTFQIANFGTLKSFKHGTYVIHGTDEAGFCILDRTTAAAGPLPALYAALDHWHSRAAPATPDLLKLLEQVSGTPQIWAVSKGGFNIPGSMTMRQGGTDFAQIFRGVERSAFWADLRTGVDATIEADVKTEEDAKNLGDAARGAIGLGRLSVPDNHRELLKMWDGFHVDQRAQHITITIKVAQDMIDHLVSLLQSGDLKPRAPTL